jgi:type I restriction enzyme S subunit
MNTLGNWWKECKLGDVSSKIGSGATPNGSGKSYKSTGISLIRSQNVLDFDFSNDGLAYIDDNQANELRNVEVLGLKQALSEKIA